MAGKAKIAALAFGNVTRQGKRQEEMLAHCLAVLEQLAGCHTDLVCFPEEVLIAGGQREHPDWAALNAHLLDRLCEWARKAGSMVACCLEEPSERHPGKRYNTAYLIDRKGAILGTYRKRYLTFRALENDGIPGNALPVFETDIGRIGMQTCFDIGWRAPWTALGEKRCDLVLWNAAYDGGTLLNAYAAHNMYFIASSVWTDHAKLIDPMGRTVEESSTWDGVAMATLHLDTEIFHIDRQEHCPAEIRRRLGDRVLLRSYSQENVFTVASNDVSWPVERIKAEFGLVSYRAYHEEYGRINEAWRERYP